MLFELEHNFLVAKFIYMLDALGSLKLYDFEYLHVVVMTDIESQCLFIIFKLTKNMLVKVTS